MRKLLLAFLALCTLLLSFAQAQALARTQELTAFLDNANDTIYYILTGVRPGETLFAALETTSGNLVAALDVGQVDAGGSFTPIPSLEFPNREPNTLGLQMPDSLEVVLAVRRTDASTSGAFRLLVGVNTTMVLKGQKQPFDDALVTLHPEDAAFIDSITPTPVPRGAVRVQEVRGSIDEGGSVAFFDVRGLYAGETVYLYVEGTSRNLDSYMYFGSADFDNILNPAQIIAENDDIDFPDNLNSAMEVEIEEDGDYRVAVTSFDSSSSGVFRLLVGVNAPEVLDGRAQQTGNDFVTLLDLARTEEVAIPQPPSGAVSRVEQVEGTIDTGFEYSFFDIPGLAAGDVLYVYVQGTSRNLDPYVYLGSAGLAEVLKQADDVSPRNTDTAMFFEVPADGIYTLAVTHFDSTSTGRFRMLVGVNAPEVLTGTATAGASGVIVPQPERRVADTGIITTAAISLDRSVSNYEGTLGSSSPSASYAVEDLVAGDTIFIYAETTNGDLDVNLSVSDLNGAVLGTADNITGDNLNAALQVPVAADGDYLVTVGTANAATSGTYRLLVGVNAPEVLSQGDAGERVALLYGDTEIPITDCSRLFPRPVMAGETRAYQTPRFLIHYSKTGRDAATSEFVIEIAQMLDEVWDFQIEQQGWPQPVRDCGEGGDRRYDIYLRDIIIIGALGYASPEGLVGDNPNSPGVEQFAAYSHLVLDNDYEGVEGLSPETMVRNVVAHEFHHAIQFGYDIRDSGDWYYEATAVWMQTQNYPNDLDPGVWADFVFGSPSLCIGNRLFGYFGSLRIYGEWLLLDSISRDYGPAAIRRLWELIADGDGMAALYRLMGELGTTPEDMLRRYAVRNLLRDYAIGASFDSSVYVGEVISGAGDYTSLFGVDPMGVEYLLIDTPGSYTFSVAPSDLRLIVVGVTESDNSAQVFDLGTSGTVDTAPFDAAYLIVLNPTQHTDPELCLPTEWRVSVGAAGGGGAAPSNEQWSSVNFRG